MDLSKKDWRKKNIEFLSKHNYFTSYAKENLDPLKQVYLEDLNKKVNGEEKPDKKNNKDTKATATPQKEKKKEKGLTDDEQKKLGRGKKEKRKRVTIRKSRIYCIQDRCAKPK
jgi:hypothetical protein